MGGTRTISVENMILLVGRKMSELDRRIVVVGIWMEGEGFEVQNLDLLLEFGEDVFGGIEVNFDDVECSMMYGNFLVSGREFGRVRGMYMDLVIG